MRGVALVCEVVVKITIACAAGLGSGLVAFGVALLKQGDAPRTFQDLERQGPPIVETFLAIGVGLLVMAGLLLILSVGPLAQRRWFVGSEPPELPPEHGEFPGGSLRAQ